jgi:hypothetical protein
MGTSVALAGGRLDHRGANPEILLVIVGGSLSSKVVIFQVAPTNIAASASSAWRRFTITSNLKA